jgi:hypothetical protein
MLLNLVAVWSARLVHSADQQCRPIRRELLKMDGLLVSVAYSFEVYLPLLKQLELYCWSSLCSYVLIFTGQITTERAKLKL